MATRIIGCEDCHHWEETTAKNTKRCYICRLVQNLGFVRDRQAKCWVCDTKFCPIARDDQLCPKCAFPKSGAEQITCAYCERPGTSIAKDIRVCMGCARDPKRRKWFLNAMLEKQKERMATDPGPRPELPEKPVEVGPSV